MPTRETKIHQEAVELWQALFPGQAPPNARGAELLDLVTERLPTEGYVRLRSPFLRPSTIVGPNQPNDDQALN